MRVLIKHHYLLLVFPFHCKLNNANISYDIKTARSIKYCACYSWNCYISGACYYVSPSSEGSFKRR
ncbi:hypothetical protein MTBPR1_20082 [Candidatus Terasakiella magnetica]|uniref:Uncharacterized protein n=1 Tax=Candidatus Terasakiella magnetica TaxID=1867952 RepID=A0A1C3RG99_9PROT|nr:hypothetical protein MTBPR1_20082 [Candidatus Terasakiella magnetica]